MHPHADQLRLIPESDPDFARLYGLRNDAESNNHSYKSTLPGRRAAALGWRRQLLDAAGWAILINARAHARHGPPQPPPALDVVTPEPLERLLGPAIPQPVSAPPSPATQLGRSRTFQLLALLLREMIVRRPTRRSPDGPGTPR